MNTFTPSQTHNALRNIFGTTEFVSKGVGVVSESKHLCEASEGLSGVEVLEKPYHVDRNASKSLSLLLWSIALCAQINRLFIQLVQLSLSASGIFGPARPYRYITF